MKIKKVDLNRLRNEEHFQFHTDFNALTESYTPIALDIEAAFTAFQPFYNDESEALDIIRRSAFTDDIAAADALRDHMSLQIFCFIEQKHSYCLSIPQKRREMSFFKNT